MLPRRALVFNRAKRCLKAPLNYEIYTRRKDTDPKRRFLSASGLLKQAEWIARAGLDPQKIANARL